MTTPVVSFHAQLYASKAVCNTRASELVCCFLRSQSVSHPSDHGAGTVEPGLTVIMDWMPGILQSTRVYIHFRLERPQDCLKFDLFQSICFASQQLQIAFDAWQDRGLSDF